MYKIITLCMYNVYVNYNLLFRYNVYLELLYTNMCLGRWPYIWQ